jgi:hypothetical protein
MTRGMAFFTVVVAVYMGTKRSGAKLSALAPH